MKVRELIERLQTMDPDAPVLIPGYESGWNEANQCNLTNVHASPDAGSWYDGDWQIAYDNSGKDACVIHTKADGLAHMR